MRSAAKEKRLLPCAHCGVSTRRTCDFCCLPTCVQGGRFEGERWACLKCRPFEVKPKPAAVPSPPSRPQATSTGVSRIDARARDVLEDERLAFARGSR